MQEVIQEKNIPYQILGFMKRLPNNINYEYVRCRICGDSYIRKKTGSRSRIRLPRIRSCNTVTCGKRKCSIANMELNRRRTR